jgi:hypothetical protein
MRSENLALFSSAKPTGARVASIQSSPMVAARFHSTLTTARNGVECPAAKEVYVKLRIPCP